MRKSSIALSFLFCLLSATLAFAGDGVIHRHHSAIPRSYLIKVPDDVPVALLRSFADRIAKQEHARLVDVFPMINSFAVADLPGESAMRLAHDPAIDFVEEDGVFTLATLGQQNAPWHLDRIDQRQLQLDTWYWQDCVSNSGVVAYVIDSGVLQAHTEFAITPTPPPPLPSSRVEAGVDLTQSNSGTATDPCPLFGTQACPNDPSCDTYGGSHGTAVASILAGNIYGVAKRATIVPVRVVACGASGTDLFTMEQAMQWVYNDHAQRGGSAVINISGAFSLQMPNVSAFELSVDKAVNEGNMTVVASAGNGNADASTMTPARHSRSAGGTVITVGGSNKSDSRWMCDADPLISWDANCTTDPGSNFGAVIDLFAPAQNIPAAGIKDATGAATNNAERAKHRSGTSFSAPIVAGLAARWLADYGSPSSTPADVWNVLLTEATSGVMTELGPPDSGPLNGSPNRLAYFPPQVRCGR